MKTRKTPIKHRVRSYKRENTVVGAYVRGSGLKSRPNVADPALLITPNTSVKSHISDYANERMNNMERHALKDLIHAVLTSSDLSDEFKKAFKIDMSAKYQTLHLELLDTSSIQLGTFEYTILGRWSEKYGIDWEWGDEDAHDRTIQIELNTRR